MKQCEKCNSDIPLYIVKGTRKVYISLKRKMCFACSPYGNGNRHPAERLLRQEAGEKFCPKCRLILPVNEFYSIAEKGRRGVYGWCKVCARRMVVDRQNKVKKECVAYKGRKCVIYSYTKCLGALHFHHLDPKEKDFTISKRPSTKFNDIMKQELDKCILVCSNCHAEIHAGIISLKSPATFLNPSSRD